MEEDNGRKCLHNIVTSAHKLASMFGRDLAEQISTDNLAVPAIVSKCIGAVEVVGKSTPRRTEHTWR